MLPSVQVSVSLLVLTVSVRAAELYVTDADGSKSVENLRIPTYVVLFLISMLPENGVPFIKTLTEGAAAALSGITENKVSARRKIAINFFKKHVLSCLHAGEPDCKIATIYAFIVPYGKDQIKEQYLVTVARGNSCLLDS